MEAVAYMLIDCSNDKCKCERILEEYMQTLRGKKSKRERRQYTMMNYFRTSASSSVFRRLLHCNKGSLELLQNEIKKTKVYKQSIVFGAEDDTFTSFVFVTVLYMNTILSVRGCSLFCDIPVKEIETQINLFNRIMNELKDKVIRFPSLGNQSLLRINSKRFFPGAVGVVDSVFLPKLSSCVEKDMLYPGENRKQGIKLLLVIGREGEFFNVHISENGNQSNTSLFNESAVGYTLRHNKRSVLNRGSFLIADRSYPELPYLQVPFSTGEIEKSTRIGILSNYNYWHHKTRFISEKSIQRWLHRSPKCLQGLPYTSSRNCIIFVITSLVLHQLFEHFNDHWRDDDAAIQLVVIATKDGSVYKSVDEECHRIYDIPDEKDVKSSYEVDYYDLNSMDIPSTDKDSISVSTYEKLQLVARKRRDFLVDLVNLFPNRSVSSYD